MPPPLRRWVISTILTVSFFVVLFHLLAAEPHIPYNTHRKPPKPKLRPIDEVLHPGFFKPKFRWRNVKQHHPVPVDKLTPLPTGEPVTIPKVQYEFGKESAEDAQERERRRDAVKAAFVHSWNGYKQNAWLKDEVAPLTGNGKNPFGGWAATLIDSLDTLTIMGLEKDFAAALSSLKSIDFVTSTLREVNLFETTIRYLGGLLAAYDVSGHKHSILLQKAVDLGEMLYLAFDTPNRMPVTSWRWEQTALGKSQEAKKRSLLAELGSLSLEFTRLSQLTGNLKYYDAIARITDLFEEAQNNTKIPGLWPTMLNPAEADFTKEKSFTLGGMADSMYEYLPKQHLLLAGHTDQYRSMYTAALEPLKKEIFFRPLTPGNREMLVPGTVTWMSKNFNKLKPQGEHLGCFAGGMVGLAAKIFQQKHDLKTARELVDGCIWAYESMPTGIMPEIFTALPCEQADVENCAWNEQAWHKDVLYKSHRGFNTIGGSYDVEEAKKVIKENKLAPGMTEINDARFLLRPEAIESVFVMYRITGDRKLQDKAWEMFQAIDAATKTDIAYAALKDVTKPDSGLSDSMESFWTAETLKYFYLIFSEPDLISLDDYVLNTEAHPFLRPK